MKFFLVVFRAILIGANLILINFEPLTELETNMFFATRLVFFLMLVIDYTHVAYYNDGLEKLIGILGVIVALIITCIDGAGFFNFLVLTYTDSGYIISGNDSNFLTSMINSFSASSYVFYSWLSVVIVVGMETFNHGARHLPNIISEARKRKVA